MNTDYERKFATPTGIGDLPGHGAPVPNVRDLRHLGGGAVLDAATRTVEQKSIPFCAPWMTDDYAYAVGAQIGCGFLGPGKAGEAVCRKLEQITGAKHALLVTSGTVALTIAAQMVGLRPGEEVIVPAYGVIATANALVSGGFSVRPADVEIAGFLTVDTVKAAMTPATRAVCVVDFGGAVGPWMRDLREFCDENGLYLIEDAACGIGQSWNGKAAGAFGHIGILSFSGPKPVTCGQGGAILFQSTGAYERAKAAICHGVGWSKTGLSESIGTNFRLSDLQAALLLPQLECLDEIMARRRAAHQAMAEALDLHVLKFFQQGNPPLFNRYRSERAEELCCFLNVSGIEAKRQYCTLTRHPAYQRAGGKYPMSDMLTEQTVYLPFGTSLSAEDARTIGQAVAAFEKEAGV